MDKFNNLITNHNCLRIVNYCFWLTQAKKKNLNNDNGYNCLFYLSIIMAFPSDRWDIMAFFYDDESDTTTASTPSTSTQVLLYGEGGISKGQHYSHFH